MRLRTCLIALLATYCAAQAPPTRDIQIIRVPRRHAFVVGNSAYPNSPLKNPINDAADLAASLRRLGFQVTAKSDLTQRAFEQSLNEFTRQVSSGDLALVYFAGHGLQVENENYLVPIDFAAENEADVPFIAFPASRLRSRLEATGAAVRVIVLDACRNNPFKFKRSGGAGLAAMTQAAEGTIIAFAAGDNQTADDNKAERNGLYTKFLLATLEEPGLHLKDIFERTRAQVWQASGRKQFPALYDMVVGRLILKEGPATAASTPVPPAPTAPSASTINEEDVFWRQCESAKGVFCEAYLKRFPDGRFAELARLILNPAPPPTTARPPINPPAATNPPSSGTYQAGQTRTGADGLPYVWIPPGSFRMGCSEGDTECSDTEKSARQVTIDRGFWMGQTEVTQEAYERRTGKNPSAFKGPNLPVETVSWQDANAYCRGLGLKLPTAEQWEYAARAGSTASRYGDLDRIAWFSSNSGKKTHRVATKEANAWSLYDMLGNVWEWTATKYSATEYEVRGGSWDVNGSGVLRASFRGIFEPVFQFDYLGFRCVGE